MIFALATSPRTQFQSLFRQTCSARRASDEDAAFQRRREYRNSQELSVSDAHAHAFGCAHAVLVWTLSLRAMHFGTRPPPASRLQCTPVLWASSFQFLFSFFLYWFGFLKISGVLQKIVEISKGSGNFKKSRLQKIFAFFQIMFRNYNWISKRHSCFQKWLTTLKKFRISKKNLKFKKRIWFLKNCSPFQKNVCVSKICLRFLNCSNSL